MVLLSIDFPVNYYIVDVVFVAFIFNENKLKLLYKRMSFFYFTFLECIGLGRIMLTNGKNVIKIIVTLKWQNVFFFNFFWNEIICVLITMVYNDTLH